MEGVMGWTTRDDGDEEQKKAERKYFCKQAIIWFGSKLFNEILMVGKSMKKKRRWVGLRGAMTRQKERKNKKCERKVKLQTNL